MKVPMIMTAGPTEVNEQVRKAMSERATNPDLDMNFFEFYKESIEKLKMIYKTKNETFILNGEGMLGLDSACCSLIEKGDRVLCIENGIFGKGFGPMCETYGAEVIYFSSDYKNTIDVEKLEEFLKLDSNFKIATMVHCETPSGIVNPVEKIAELLNRNKIISVVDAVSSLGGEELETDKWGLDIVLGGSQKAISSPTGLTYITISQRAFDKMEARKEPIPSFYCNLLLFRSWYQDREFPYTQPVYNLVANDIAFDICLASDYLNKHKKIAIAVRSALKRGGLELYAESGHANTVTAVMVPESIAYEDLFNTMVKDYNIMISGSLGELYNKVFRIGHMGENASEDKIYMCLNALNNTFEKLGFKPKEKLHLSFVEEVNK